ncbi:MAG: hypothetical protein GY862_03560 [Gammaproteobacteria bacterium]|nr:hypothetical protein [Gammaproteobacteria bacterium]
MVNTQDLHPKYIMDDKGRKSSVVISIADFQELIEDIEDLAAIAERKDEGTVSHKDLLEELKKDGFI